MPRDSIVPSDLTPREGKVLRYVCGYTAGSYWNGRQENVEPDMCVIKGSERLRTNLPSNSWEAKKTLERLRSLRLVKRRREGYDPTKAGHALVASANAEGLWQAIYE